MSNKIFIPMIGFENNNSCDSKKIGKGNLAKNQLKLELLKLNL